MRERDGVPLLVQEDELSRVIVDFRPIEHPEHARLVVTAWGFYADFTAAQRPPYSAGTTIETQDENGQWQVRLVAGKAAGDSKTWIMAHGDQLALEFEAPPPCAGTVRYVFLEADVFYSLMYHPLRFLTSTIEPLPYHGMERYPYDPALWPYAGDASYQEYLETWNTRLIQLPEQLRAGQSRAR